MRFLPAALFVAVLCIMHLAAGGTVVREIPVPAKCPTVLGVWVGEHDGRECAIVYMSNRTQTAFCEPEKLEAHEDPSSGLEGSRT